MLRALLAVALVFGLSISSGYGQGKRPLTHADYDIWNSITGMTLSPDGQFVAYTLGAGRGDATFIVKNIATGIEWKFARGGTSSATTPGAAESKGDDDEIEDQRVGFGPPGASATAGLSGGPTFTPDSRFLYFVQTPTRAEVEKATAAKKKPEDMPQAAIAVLDLSTGKIRERITGVRRFSIIGKGAGILLLSREPKREPPKTESKAETSPMPRPANPDDQEPKPAAEPESSERRSGSDLLIRDLADGREAVFAEVQDYAIPRDCKQIVYIVSSKKPEANGVFVADLFKPASAQAIVKGAGRYYRLTWDDPQRQLAFFFDDSPPPANTPPAAPTNPQGPGRGGRRFGMGGNAEAPTIPTLPNTKPRVYLWQRAKPGETVAAAVLAIGPDTPGLKKGWQVVDRGGLSFTADGQKLNVSTAPEPEKPAEPKKSPTGPAATDRIELDLWHWKDEAIQPMQKVRANTVRNRSFAAVYFLDTKRLAHLADDDRSARAPDYGDWALGSSDKSYRAQTWESPVPSDYVLVNVRTGETKSILNAARSSLTPSPKGNYLAGFDGRHWFTISVPEGKKTVLTANLTPKFFNEDADTPTVPPPYPQVGWSSDDKYFFVTDRHDIWRFAPDGSEATNVTKIGASSGIRFRLARVEKAEDSDAPAERGLDTSANWLLAAENLTTRDSGFYRMEPGQTPKLLVMGARSYGTPVKAKSADTMIFTISTLVDYPDYYATTSDFREIKRLTDANPHRSDFNWATAELIQYTNGEGVKLSGILVKPENFDPAKKYPMIVYIYERLSAGLHSYKSPSVTRGQTINPVWYASNGYLVLMPDIAYKIGYPGQSALQCVLPAIQTVVDRGIVDESAIGINGQSWGGYQIAYMVTRTSRFKAAVAGAAVTNMTSAYNGIRWGSGMARQFQYERTQSRIGETLWQAPLKYIENSPVFMADRVTTPVMMINNDADDAVPWYQGIEFYLSLRRLGKEVYMLNYNGEGHNLARVANARDFALRMHQFFEHHLKGAPMPEWMEKGIPFVERDKEKEQWKKLFGPEKPARTDPND